MKMILMGEFWTSEFSSSEVTDVHVEGSQPVLVVKTLLIMVPCERCFFFWFVFGERYSTKFKHNS